jgi:hypothetical protein
MKMRLLVCLLMLWNLSYSQTILHQLTKDKMTKKDNEMILEITESFKKVNDSLKIDFNHADTLFIIRGVDIQSRTGYGYIWNSRLKSSYIDNKIWKKNKIVGSSPKIKIKTNKMTWNEFDDLTPIIEKWDTLEIKKYVDNCGEVLSGIYWWTIIRLVKSDSHYDLDLIYVRDFGMCNENKKNKNASR